jgi:indolepyruvate ferredoxin oxidoreductase
MAIKDEYEVARLHTQTGFAQQLAADFEPGFTLRYHLAPPMLPARKDSRGRPVKRSFGAWMTPVMRALARMRRLRGTALDPFAYGRERREEVALIGWYEGILDQIAPALKLQQADLARQILSAPLEFRGYGPVKSAAVAKGKPQADRLLAGLMGH